MNPKTGSLSKINERQEIFLYVTDSAAQIQQCLYTRDGFMLTDVDGKPLTSVKSAIPHGLYNPKTVTVVQNPSVYRLSPLSAYDEMKIAS